MLTLTDGERVIINHIGSKLQMYDSEFHKYHYRLVDFIDDAVELEVQQRIHYDHCRRMMDFFKQMTNLRTSQKNIVTPPPKPVEETIYLGAYYSRLQLIRSRTWIIDESVDQTKVETVDDGVLKHLLEQVNKLHTNLEVIIRELISIRHQGKPLPQTIDLDKILRKMKFTLTQMISRHQKLTELMEIAKDDHTNSTSSNNSGPTKANAVSIKLPKLSISKLDRDILNWRIF